VGAAGERATQAANARVCSVYRLGELFRVAGPGGALGIQKIGKHGRDFLEVHLFWYINGGVFWRFDIGFHISLVGVVSETCKISAKNRRFKGFCAGKMGGEEKTYMVQ
jgi:hypothetical protein